MPGRRSCGCGCGEQLVGRSENTLYVNERHRQRAYRRRLKEAAEAAKLPSSLSFKSIESAQDTQRRNGDGHTQRPKRRRTPRPGVTCYFPTVEAAEAARRAIDAAHRDLAHLDQAQDALEAAVARRRARG